MTPRIFLAFFLIEAMCVDHERLGLKRRPRYLKEETLSRVVLDEQPVAVELHTYAETCFRSHDYGGF